MAWPEGEEARNPSVVQVEEEGMGVNIRGKSGLDKVLITEPQGVDAGPQESMGRHPRESVKRLGQAAYSVLKPHK